MQHIYNLHYPCGSLLSQFGEKKRHLFLANDINTAPYIWVRVQFVIFYIENVSHVIAATETFPKLSLMVCHVKKSWLSVSSRLGCTECVWAEAAQQVVFVCPCIGVFKSNLRHKYMQQVSITSVHKICSSTKNPDKANEITINKQMKTLLYTLWRMYTQCKTIRQICVQSIMFNCTHIQYSSAFQGIRSWSFKTRRDK